MDELDITLRTRYCIECRDLTITHGTASPSLTELERIAIDQNWTPDELTSAIEERFGFETAAPCRFDTFISKSPNNGWTAPLLNLQKEMLSIVQMYCLLKRTSYQMIGAVDTD